MEIKKHENQIIRGMLTPLKFEMVDAVAFHHMANSSWGFCEVEKYHILKNGWMAIGYNYWIGFDGTVWEGRGLNIGAGIAGHNSHVISVGLQGDFMTDKPTEEQYKACAELYKYLKEKIPSIKKYARHCDYNKTLCPGKNFDISEIEKYINKEEKKVEKIYNWTTACPEWSQPYVHKALELGIIEGDEKGQLNLNDEKIWTLTVLIRAMNLKGGQNERI